VCVGVFIHQQRKTNQLKLRRYTDYKNTTKYFNYRIFSLQIKLWITFNEPSVFTGGYESNTAHAPSIEAPGFGKYLASHTVLKAHARAYHLYDEKYREKQKGK
jgi:lactase-phlorizin hydrolase